MGFGVLSELHHNPATAHFVGNCTSGAGAGKGVKHYITHI